MRVSVIIPTHDRAHCLGEAIDSVLAQSRPADEIVVVDDGSTDGTPDVLGRYAGRIVALRRAQAGLTGADIALAQANQMLSMHQAGIARATGDWIAFLDSDDLWLPNRLAVLARDVGQAPERIVGHVADLRIVGAGHDWRLLAMWGLDAPEGSAIEAPDLFSKVLSGAPLQPTAARRSAILAAGGFDVAMRLHEDTALVSRLAMRGGWLVAGDLVAEMRRLPGDAAALNAQERERARWAADMKVGYLDGLLAAGPTPAQRRLIDRSASHALMNRARAEAAEGLPHRASALAAARRHPEPLKGWLKAAAPLLLGRPGYRVAFANERRYDRG